MRIGFVGGVLAGTAIVVAGLGWLLSRPDLGIAPDRSASGDGRAGDVVVVVEQDGTTPSASAAVSTATATGADVRQVDAAGMPEAAPGGAEAVSGAITTAASPAPTSTAEDVPGGPDQEATPADGAAGAMPAAPASSDPAGGATATGEGTQTEGAAAQGPTTGAAADPLAATDAASQGGDPAPGAAAPDDDYQRLAALPPPVPGTPDHAAPGLATPGAMAPAEAPATPRPPADPQAPRFDIVRVDAAGQTVIAGSARPEQLVEVLLDGEVVETVHADAAGKFVVIIGAALDGEARQLQLRVRRTPEAAQVSGTNAAEGVSDGSVSTMTEPPVDTATPTAATDGAAENGGAAPTAATVESPSGSSSGASGSAGATGPDAVASPSAPAPHPGEMASRSAEPSVAALDAQADTTGGLAGGAVAGGAPADDAASEPRLDAKAAVSADTGASSGGGIPADRPATEAAQTSSASTGGTGGSPAATAAPAPPKPSVAVRVPDLPASGGAPTIAPATAPTATEAPDATIQVPRDVPVAGDGALPDPQAPASEKSPAPAAAGGVPPQPEPDPAGEYVLSAPVLILPQAQGAGAPALVQPQTDRLALLQPGGGASAESADSVVLDQITYEQDGDVSMRGRARNRHSVRIYGNGRLVDTAPVQDGAWNATLPRERVQGLSLFRLDEIGPAGQVTARIEAPFRYNGTQQPQVLRDRAVVIQKGDNLWTIAEQYYGEGLRYSLIYGANSELIRDPDLIYPDQVFTIPELVEAE